MRHLLTAIFVSIIAIVLFMEVDWRAVDFNLSLPTLADTSHDEPAQYDESAEELCVDTVASANGHSFGYSGDVTEWEETEREVKFELPEGALTETGIVFSFQPYEIDCWAAGAYHFIVPYNKIMPYLTTKAKTICGSLL